MNEIVYAIEIVETKKACEIIENRIPLGLFYTVDVFCRKVKYIGIDNSEGEALVEEFLNLYDCKKWLMGED